MPRQRKPRQEWLKDHPGLYVTNYGTYYVKHPVTGRQGSLETKNRTIAIRRWALLNKKWEEDRADFLTDRLANRLEGLQNPKATHNFKYLCDYITHWRENVLGHRIVNNKTTWTKCLIVSKRGKNRGGELAHQTKVDYAHDCKQLEESPNAKIELTDRYLVRKVRILLRPWVNKPTHHNGLRNTLSRICEHAINEGVIDTNPMRDISKLEERKREVHILDEAYVAITEKMMVHRLNKRKFDGEWQARVCDMIYMMSQQPIDVFGLLEEQIVDAGEFGELHLTRHKTGNAIIIEMNKEMADLIAWFRNFKKEQEIVSPYIMVYPRYFDMRSRGRPVKHRFIQKQWANAVKAAGFDGMYQLRDLRKKGLTEEFLKQGDNDKGGHDTEAMKNHYRLIKPPKRARNTLGNLRVK